MATPVVESRRRGRDRSNPNPTPRRRGWRPSTSAAALPLALLALAIVGGSFTSGFFSTDNIKSVLINASLTGIVAVAMTPLTLSGNMVALNLGSSAMLSGILFVTLLNHGVPPIVAVVAVALAMLAVGCVQALLVIRGLNPVVTTLAADSIIYGAVAELTNLRDVIPKHHTLAWLGSSLPLGVPIQVFIFAIVAVLVSLFTSKTVAGRQIILAGAGRETAELSGVSRPKVIIWAFGILSLGVAVAGVLNAAQLGIASSTDFPTLTFDVIAAVLVGGTSFQGGKGNPARSAGGAILIAVVTNIMLLHNLSTGWQDTGEGLLVLVMIVVLHVLSRRSER